MPTLPTLSVLPGLPALSADSAFAAYKHQVDVALGVVEALVEAAEKAREIQLAAAVDVHAALEATRKSLEAATTLPELLELQQRFFTGNFGKALAYWGALSGTTRDAQTRIAALLTGAPQLSAFPAFDIPGFRMPEKTV